MLAAILLSVEPGLDVGGGAVYGVALIGAILYTVYALGGIYDLATNAIREVRG